MYPLHYVLTRISLKWKRDHVIPLLKPFSAFSSYSVKAKILIKFSRRPFMIWSSFTSCNSSPSSLLCSSHTDLLAVPWIYQVYSNLKASVFTLSLSWARFPLIAIWRAPPPPLRSLYQMFSQRNSPDHWLNPFENCDYSPPVFCALFFSTILKIIWDTICFIIWLMYVSLH